MKQEKTTFPSFSDYITEDKIKSAIDAKFIDKIATTLKEGGMKVKLNKEKGYLIVTGSDDEKVSLEYKY